MIPPLITLQHAEIKLTNQLFLKIDDFQLQKHEFAVIVGHNGSGKSSLAKFLVQHQPESYWECHHQQEDARRVRAEKRSQGLTCSLALQAQRCRDRG